MLNKAVHGLVKDPRFLPNEGAQTAEAPAADAGKKA